MIKASPIFAVILLLSPAAVAQVSLSPSDQRSYGQYGEPQPVELSQIAYQGETYQKRNVRTKGDLGPLPPSRYYVLSEGGAQVLLILVPELESRSAATQLMGARVEITGVVRVLPQHQAVLRCGLESKCNDPDLPELPNARLDWPRVSITVFSMSDIGVSPRRGTPGSQLTIEDLVTDPGPHAGKTVRVLGQFRGRNLFGDLPSGSQRALTDWVLRDGGHALWVTGKRPKGKGWDLDPDYKGDAVRWLEVVGRPQTRDGVVYLRASKVLLTTPPAARSAEPDKQ